MATANGDGGDELLSGGDGERARGGEGHRESGESERGTRESAWHS